MKRVACLLLLFTPLPALAGTLEGDVAWRAGDYAKAVSEYRSVAETGDAEAQMRMGDAYRLGRGVATNQDAALGWYRRSAALGNARARDSLGLTLFALGRRAEALPVLEQGIAGGDPRILYVVGTAHFNGDNVPRDWPRAYALMTRASAAGLPQAKASLDVMERYLFPADKVKARALLAGGLGTRTAAPVARPTTRTPVALVPRPRPAPVAVSARGSASGGWKVQLGAFGSSERADATWTRLSTKVPALRGLDKRVVEAGAVQRLQAGGIPSGSAAAGVCRAVKAAGGDCLAIPPGR